MLKRIVITIAVTIIVLLVAIWVYLLFFGSPQNASDVFVDLGFREESIERPVVRDADVNPLQPETIAIDNKPLAQITVRPIAGYLPISNLNRDVIVYAEKGTGHIYEINFQNNLETRLLGKTIAKASDAFFSPQAEAVVISSYDNNTSTHTFMTIPRGGASSIEFDLENDINHINVVSSTTVLYTKIVNQETVAYSWNRNSGFSSEIWRIPLTQVEVIWEQDGAYVINKPAPRLRGGVFQVLDNKLQPLNPLQYSYTAMFMGVFDAVIETYFDQETDKLISVVTDKKWLGQMKLPVLTLPEKCAATSINFSELWCGSMAPGENTDRNFIRDWYMGAVVSNDYLWKINTEKQEAEVMVNFPSSAGFIVDIINPQFNTAGDKLFFINKINDFLWMYKVESSND